MTTQGRPSRDLIKDTNAGVAYPKEQSTQSNTNIDASNQVVQLGDKTSTAQAMSGLVKAAQPFVDKAIERKARTDFETAYNEGVAAGNTKVDKQDGFLDKILYGRSASLRGAQKAAIENSSRGYWIDAQKQLTESEYKLDPESYKEQQLQDMMDELEKYDDEEMRSAFIESRVASNKSLARMHAQAHEVYKRQVRNQTTLDSVDTLDQQLAVATEEDDIQEIETELRQLLTTRPEGMSEEAHANTMIQGIINSITKGSDKLYNMAEETGLLDSSAVDPAQRDKLDLAITQYRHKRSKDVLNTQVDLASAINSGSVEEARTLGTQLIEEHGMTNLDLNKMLLKAQEVADQKKIEHQMFLKDSKIYLDGGTVKSNGEAFTAADNARMEKYWTDLELDDAVMDARNRANMGKPLDQQDDVNRAITEEERMEAFYQNPRRFSKILLQNKGKSQFLSNVVSKALMDAQNPDGAAQERAVKALSAIEDLTQLNGMKLRASLSKDQLDALDKLTFFTQAGAKPRDALDHIGEINSKANSEEFRKYSEGLTDEEMNAAWDKAEEVLFGKAKHFMGLDISIFGFEPFRKEPGNAAQARADWEREYRAAVAMVGPDNIELAQNLAAGRVLHSSIVVEESALNTNTRFIPNMAATEEQLQGVGYAGYQEFIEDIAKQPKLREDLLARGVPEKYLVGATTGSDRLFSTLTTDARSARLQFGAHGIDIWHPDIQHIAVPGGVLLLGKGDGTNMPWSYRIKLPESPNERELLRDREPGALEGIGTGMMQKLGIDRFLQPQQNTQPITVPLRPGNQKQTEVQKRLGIPSEQTPPTGVDKRIEDRIAELEGFRSGAYKPVDTEEHLTIGYGHYGAEVQKGDKLTEPEARALLRKDIAARMPTIRRKLPGFDNLSEDLQVEIVQSWFRGGMSGSPATRALINKGDFAAAAKEFLNNDEYRNPKTLRGVKTRMEAVAAALQAEASK